MDELLCQFERCSSVMEQVFITCPYSVESVFSKCFTLSLSGSS
jgi:hypothetical protein